MTLNWVRKAPAMLMWMFSSCAHQTGMDNMLHVFTTQEQDPGVKLRIRGGDGSSYGTFYFTSLRSEVRGSCLHLTIWKSQWSPRYPVMFDCDVQVPNSVDEVRIGTSDELVWDRTHGIAKPPLATHSPSAGSGAFACPPPLTERMHKALETTIENSYTQQIQHIHLRRVSVPVPGKVSLKDTAAPREQWGAPF